MLDELVQILFTIDGRR